MAALPCRSRGDRRVCARKFGFILPASRIPISPFCAPPLVIPAAAAAVHNGGSARVLPSLARHSESRDRSASPQATLRSSASRTGLLRTHGSLVEVLVKAASVAALAHHAGAACHLRRRTQATRRLRARTPCPVRLQHPVGGITRIPTQSGRASVWLPSCRPGSLEASPGPSRSSPGVARPV